TPARPATRALARPGLRDAEGRPAARARGGWTAHRIRGPVAPTRSDQDLRGRLPRRIHGRPRRSVRRTARGERDAHSLADGASVDPDDGTRGRLPDRDPCDRGRSEPPRCRYPRRATVVRDT